MDEYLLSWSGIPRLLNTQEDGSFVADNDGWVLMTIGLSQAYVENDYELSLTLTPIPSQPTAVAESYTEICGAGEIVIEEGMTIHAARPPYLATTYTFYFYETDGWLIDIWVDESYNRTETLAELSNVPFTWREDGEMVVTIESLGC